jgi:malate dehydrogenase
LGAKGVEQVIQLELTEDEKVALNKSADAVREILTVMGV